MGQFEDGRDEQLHSEAGEERLDEPTVEFLIALFLLGLDISGGRGGGTGFL